MSRDIDLSLYLVLDPDLCGGPRAMIDTARAAAANGASVVQLRAPGWKKRAWLSAAQALKLALTPYKVALIINDHVDIALAVDADGVHVGQGDLPVETVRALLGPAKIVGLSVSTSAELAAVPATGVDYLGIGPVYATATKLDATPASGLSAFAALVALSPRPVVAIGGIRTAHCAELLAAGANGVAVVSAVCGQHDPAAATRALRCEIDAARAGRGPSPSACRS